MKVLRNYETKKILLKLFILMVLFCSIEYFYTQYKIKTFSHEYIKQNAAVVGMVVSKHPDMESDVVRYYTKGLNSYEMQKGLNVFKNYGYTFETPIKNISFLNIIKKNLFKNNILILICLFAFVFLIVIYEYKYIFKKIKKISDVSEKIIENDFSEKLIEGNEGEFNILANQFNKMSDIIENSIISLNKEKSFLKDIISDISHQLKTPLASLIIFNDLFIEDKIKDNDKKTFYIKIRNQLLRMKWLIQNLLKIAKIDAKAIQFNNLYTPLILTLNRAIDPLKIKLLNKNQKINVNVSKFIKFKHDSNWLSEAFLNIIKNCIEHTACNGHIDITAIENEVSIIIKIKDNGDGISKKDLPHIFERFYKVNKSSENESVGIGLALAKSIINNEDGDISVKSVLGEWTEFTIVFLKGII